MVRQYKKTAIIDVTVNADVRGKEYVDVFLPCNLDFTPSVVIVFVSRDNYKPEYISSLYGNKNSIDDHDFSITSITANGISIRVKKYAYVNGMLWNFRKVVAIE